MGERDRRRHAGPLRVAFVVDQFPELTETFVSGEARELQRGGHRVHVEAIRRARTPDPAAAEGLAVAYVAGSRRVERLAAFAWLVARHPVRVVRDLRERDRWRPDEEPRRLRNLAPAAWRIARFGAEHVHAHFAADAALDALRLAALLGLPYSVMTHGYDVFQLPRNLRAKHERAAFAVTACEYSARHLREVVGPGVRARIHTLVVGVDGGRFRRTRPHTAERTVIAIARLSEKKGLAHLVDAAAILRDRGTPADRVLVVGDGPLRAELEERMVAHGLEDTVRLTGPRTPDETRALLEDAAVLAMPCVVAADGDRDTMPVVVKEALAMEVPVVASDEVGLPEVVQRGWGRLVPPGDPAALADALAELLALPPGERAAMGRRGRAFVLEHCSLSAETAKLAALIERHARGSQPARAAAART